jgi:chaperonin GroES
MPRKLRIRSRPVSSAIFSTRRLTPNSPVHTLRRDFGSRERRVPKRRRRLQDEGVRIFAPPNPQKRGRAPSPAKRSEETGFMKIRPLQDRILVKRIEEEEKTKGGIIIPDTAKEKPQEGKIIAVGKGKLGEDGKVTPLDVKKGDKILFSKYAGTEVNIEGEEHLIIREDDVLGVIE